MILENLTVKEIDDRATAEFGKIAKKYHLAPIYLKSFLFHRASGLNNGDMADKIGVNRNTVNKYIAALKRMDADEILSLMCFVSLMEHTHALELIGLFVKEEKLK